MSALLIYVMMLADSVGATLFILTVVAACITGCSLFACILLWSSADNPPASAFRWMKIGVVTFVVSLTVNCFVPSTKTVAMMIVIPKIATDKNMEAMGTEAKEVYELAKEALKNAASGDHK